MTAPRAIDEAYEKWKNEVFFKKHFKDTFLLDEMVKSTMVGTRVTSTPLSFFSQQPKHKETLGQASKPSFDPKKRR